jgi:hypothetical protein
VLAKLRKHVPDYDKSHLDFGDFYAGIADAVTRAKKLDPTSEQYGKNPSTSVWRLVETIMGEDDGSREG